MSQTLHQQFRTLIERGAFEPVRRHLTAVEQDDRMAEAIGQVWAMAARKAALGIKLDNALLVHAVKLRAIDHRRQLPRGGQPRRDALHFANFVDGKVIVHRLDGLLDQDGEFTGEGDTDLQSAWLSATSTDPADALASAVDLQKWIMSLGDAERALVAARFQGNTLAEIAAANDKSISNVFATLKQLGSELADRAGVSISKPRMKHPGVTSISGAALPVLTFLRRRLREREVVHEVVASRPSAAPRRGRSRRAHGGRVADEATAVGAVAGAGHPVSADGCPVVPGTWRTTSAGPGQERASRSSPPWRSGRRR